MPAGLPTIEDLYDKYSKRLYFTSLRIVSNAFDAEEIMQDTLIKYYYYSRKSEIEKIDHWLVSVCIRKSIDVLRERKRNISFLDEIKTPDHAEILQGNESLWPDSAEENREKIEHIKHSLAQLPDGYRLILSLHLFEGYDYSEIATITETKESTIRTQYMRGKNKLIEILTTK